MKDRYLARRNKLRRTLQKNGADALLVTNFTNVTYLTGFSGDDSYLLVRGDGDVILSDSRYTTQLNEECPGLDVEVRTAKTTMLASLGKVVAAAKIRSLGIEGDSLSVSLHAKLGASLGKAQLQTTSGLVERLRVVKDRDEILQLKAAARVAERAFAAARATLLPEKSEIQLRNELEYQMRLLGAQDAAFPSIIAVGPRAALPHAVPTDQTVGQHGLLLIDWGARVGHYCSDLTRVLVTGKLSTKLHRVYGVVLSAQQRAIDAIRPGKTGAEIDATARSLIADAGFGRYFGHGLGHGIGLQVHEAPRLGVTSSTVLKPGMVVTVEPGIYLPGVGGVRIEDDVLVTKTGHEVLTRVPKDWEQVVVD